MSDRKLIDIYGSLDLEYPNNNQQQDSSQQDKTFAKEWRYELRLRSGETRLVHLVPGNYEVPHHVRQDYSSLLGTVERLPVFVTVEYKIPPKLIPEGRSRGARWGKWVLDTRDTENGRDICYSLRKAGVQDIKRSLVFYYSGVEVGEFHRYEEDGYTYWAEHEEGYCPYCSQKVPIENYRPVYLRITRWAAMDIRLLEQNEISRWCLCGSGIVKVTGYLCRSCEKKMAIKKSHGKPVTPDKCVECSSYDLQILLGCSSCGKPRPATLFDVTVALTKVGTAQNVRYSLDKDYYDGVGFEVGPLPAEAEKLIKEKHLPLDFPNLLPRSMRFAMSFLDKTKLPADLQHLLEDAVMPF